MLAKANEENDNTAKESRGDAFKRIGERRLRQTLKSIQLLGNLGAYPHTAGHTKAIIDRLSQAIAGLEVKLQRTRSKEAIDVASVFGDE